MYVPYSVALVGWQDLPAPDRIRAEVEFIFEFERILGGYDGVVVAFYEDEAVHETLEGPDDMRPLQTKLHLATVAATEVALKALKGRPKSAAFQVRFEDESPSIFDAAFDEAHDG